MKYFIDTEFIEGSQKRLLSITKPTIDLISIGIVAEDGREYYAISKDFNLKEAWNRYETINSDGTAYGLGTSDSKVYWIRDNVLKPLMQDAEYIWNFPSEPNNKFKGKFDYRDFKHIINKYGKTNKQIAEEVIEFTDVNTCFKNAAYNQAKNNKELFDAPRPKFYGYYCDYDWVVFCWLFGRMIDLPKGFPMYCIDLKQTLDEKAESLTSSELSKLAYGNVVKHNVYKNYDNTVLKCTKTDLLKNAINYPKQIREHSALDDAKWNKQLYEFLKTI